MSDEITLHIYRLADFGERGGTLSRWELNGWHCWGMEAPWKDNQRFESCIPSGLYRLEDHGGDKYRDTFALVSEDLGVSHWPCDTAARYACVLHRARSHHHLSGCLAPAMGIAMDEGLPILTGSAVALQHILSTLKWSSTKLAVIHERWEP